MAALMVVCCKKEWSWLGAEVWYVWACIVVGGRADDDAWPLLVDGGQDSRETGVRGSVQPWPRGYARGSLRSQLPPCFDDSESLPDDAVFIFSAI